MAFRELDIGRLVDSMSSGIGSDQYLADTSAIFSIPHSNLGRFPFMLSEELAGKQALFYEKMLGVIAMHNVLATRAVKDELKMLIFGLRDRIMDNESTAFKRLERAAGLMHRVVCSKEIYMRSRNYPSIRRQVSSFVHNLSNYDAAELCGTADLEGIASTLDLSSSGNKAGLLSKDGYQIELMADIARNLKIPADILAYDNSLQVYTKRDYKTLGFWDPHALAFTDLKR